MCAFTYRRELKTPGKWTGLDFGNPKLAPALRVMVETLQRQNREFTPGGGAVSERIEIMMRDGYTSECYVFAPEKESGALPAMLYCHGGGFFLPVQPMMMQLATQYAAQLKMRVFLPEYRILPEYCAPVPLEDCQDVWLFMEENAESLCIDPDKMFLYRESAGGTLAAGIALWARECSRHAPAGQLLIYPALDNRCSRYPSVRIYSQAAWPLKNNLVMWREYLKNAPPDLSMLIPMRAEDFSALPDTYIEPQEMDILHDEAVAFARELQNAGVDVTLCEVAGSYHGFDADTENPFVQKIVRRRMDWMAQRLGRTV